MLLVTRQLRSGTLTTLGGVPEPDGRPASRVPQAMAHSRSIHTIQAMRSQRQPVDSSPIVRSGMMIGQSHSA